MKIEININTDTLIALNSVLKQVYELPVSNDKRENVYKSIGFDLADKFDKKCKTRVKKADLFDSKKKTKFTLKYHEAWALEEILREITPFIQNPYQVILLNKVTDTLNQKLA